MIRPLDRKPGAGPVTNGFLPLGSWELAELLDTVQADGEARRAFASRTLMLHPGGWQSFSPGWELPPGKNPPPSVRLLPLLRKLTAPPWDCEENGGAPRGGRRETTGSFLMYIRAGSWYLVLAAADSKGPPLCFFTGMDRRRIRAGLYVRGLTEPVSPPVPALMVFLVRGYFALKDELRRLYRGEDRFAPLAFLSEEYGVDFRPGGYESWYNHYTNIDEGIILDDLEGLLSTDNIVKLRYLDRGKPAVFQIDDGWQRAVGDWEIDGGRFPRGLKVMADRIEAAGLIPGLWLAPFLVTRRARIFREKPEWLLKTRRGRPVRAGWNPHWDGPFYCLDLSLPGVLEYLEALIDRVIDQWGFRYLKLDFLYAGFLPGAYASGGSPWEHYERAAALLCARRNDAAGRPLARLGCGVPLGPSYRHFPLSRIGTDTRETWDWPLARFLRHEGRPSAWLSLRDTIGRAFMNGAVFINDPDVIFFRSGNCRLTETEKECIALVSFLFGGQILCSDNTLLLSEKNAAFTRRINALYDILEGDEYGVEAIDGNGENSEPGGAGKSGKTGGLVFRVESRRGTVRGIINLGNKPFRGDGMSCAPHGITLWRGTEMLAGSQSLGRR
ncbi:MAG: alpha-galactosidase [Treponema sp.]|jgi:alpha-galactosidase|nr:alpha-galactosidase [Treponema sp.]